MERPKRILPVLMLLPLVLVAGCGGMVEVRIVTKTAMPAPTNTPRPPTPTPWPVWPTVYPTYTPVPPPGSISLGEGESFTEQTAIDLKDVGKGSVDWVDYDNDGDLDIFLCGLYCDDYPCCCATSRIYQNNGDGTFTEQTDIDLAGVLVASADWGDYDNDGYLDLLLTGQGYEGGGGSRIYRNDGDGTFTEQTSINLTDVGNGSVAWGDYDNDGDLDILLTGWPSIGGSPTHSKIYRNNGDGTFTEQTSIHLIDVGYSSVAWGDYDNDGDLDILLTGHTYEGPGESSKIYQNNGDGTFTEQTSINLTSVSHNLTGVSHGSVAWGDYDNDGDLDILLPGEHPYGSGSKISKIYQNNGNGAFTEQTSIYLEGVNYSSVAWGDYDNDGDLDILLTGCKEGPYCRTSKIYRNNGDGTFTEQTSINLTDVYKGSVAWGDYDNDGDLDILLTGRVEGNGNYVSKIYRNNASNSNTVPSAPTGLSSSTSNGTVTLSWSAASDGKTPQSGLTYNLRVGTSPGGCEVISPMSDPSTGYRRTVKMGNANQNTSWTIKNLSAGTYYWSVQAIDNGFMGSAFAPEQAFEITMTDLSLSQSVTPPPYAKATPAPAQTPTTGLVVYLRGTNNEEGFVALSGGQIDAGTIYEEGRIVYGDVAARIGGKGYHYSPIEHTVPLLSELPPGYQMEFRFSDSLLAAMEAEGIQPGFNSQKAQFWVGTLGCNSATPPDEPYTIVVKLYEGDELRASSEIRFHVADNPSCGVEAEEPEEGSPSPPDGRP